MSPRPGRIRTIIDFDFDSREGDLRADPRFGDHRHHIWPLPCEEVSTLV
ncbi:hypothetical protein AB0K60_29955 [Thermopolyspora sp. NPDC052614]